MSEETVETAGPVLVRLDSIRLDGGTQAREGLHDATVEDYAEKMAAGVSFPPVRLYFDGEHYWLADGFHRHAAAESAGVEEIAADIHEGSRREAVLYSCAANADHGLRRSNADKRRAVFTLLRDPEWSQWSNREIADRCGVTHPFVGKLRRELEGAGEAETVTSLAETWPALDRDEQQRAISGCTTLEQLAEIEAVDGTSNAYRLDLQRKALEAIPGASIEVLCRLWAQHSGRAGVEQAILGELARRAEEMGLRADFADYAAEESPDALRLALLSPAMTAAQRLWLMWTALHLERAQGSTWQAEQMLQHPNASAGIKAVARRCIDEAAAERQRDQDRGAWLAAAVEATGADLDAALLHAQGDRSLLLAWFKRAEGAGKGSDALRAAVAAAGVALDSCPACLNVWMEHGQHCPRCWQHPKSIRDRRAREAKEQAENQARVLQEAPIEQIITALEARGGAGLVSEAPDPMTTARTLSDEDLLDLLSERPALVERFAREAVPTLCTHDIVADLLQSEVGEPWVPVVLSMGLDEAREALVLCRMVGEADERIATLQSHLAGLEQEAGMLNAQQAEELRSYLERWAEGHKPGQAHGMRLGVWRDRLSRWAAAGAAEGEASMPEAPPLLKLMKPEGSGAA